MPLFALSVASRSGSGFCSGSINELCIGLCAAGLAFIAAAAFMCSKAPDTTAEATTLVQD